MLPAPESHTLPLRVVFDTNVALALEVFHDPRLALLRRGWDAGEIMALADEATLAEFERVLHYPEIGLDPAAAAVIAHRYGGRCTVVPATAQPGAPLPRCRDRDDQKFLELAERGQAHWLLTRDKALLRLARAVRFRIAQPERIFSERDPAVATRS